MLLDLPDQLVGFFLRHLSATYHILHEIAGAFDYKATQPRGGVHYIFHRRCHLAPRFETDLMRFRRHLGDSIAHVGAAVAWATRGTGSGRGGGGWSRHDLGLKRLFHSNPHLGVGFVLSVQTAAAIFAARRTTEGSVRGSIW